MLGVQLVVLELLELVVQLKQEETEQDYQQGLVLMVFLVVLLDITLAVVQEDQEQMMIGELVF